MSMRKLKRIKELLTIGKALQMMTPPTGGTDAVSDVLASLSVNMLPALERQLRTLVGSSATFFPRILELHMETQVEKPEWSIVAVDVGHTAFHTGGVEGLLDKMKKFATAPMENVEKVAIWMFPFIGPMDDVGAGLLIVHEKGSALYCMVLKRLVSMDLDTAKAEEAAKSMLAIMPSFESFHKKLAESLAKLVLKERSELDEQLKKCGVDPSRFSAEDMELIAKSIFLHPRVPSSYADFAAAGLEEALREGHNATMAAAELVELSIKTRNDFEEKLVEASDASRIKAVKSLTTSLDNTQKMLRGASERANRLDKENRELRKALSTGGNSAATASVVEDSVPTALQAFFR